MTSECYLLPFKYTSAIFSVHSKHYKNCLTLSYSAFESLRLMLLCFYILTPLQQNTHYYSAFLYSIDLKTIKISIKNKNDVNNFYFDLDIHPFGVCYSF